jgi:hypothetical protein
MFWRHEIALLVVEHQVVELIRLPYIFSQGVRRYQVLAILNQQFPVGSERRHRQ